MTLDREWIQDNTSVHLR